MMNLAVNCALVFNQYVNPVAMKALDWKYYIVYCVFLAFEFVFCYFFIIETKSKLLACICGKIVRLFLDCRPIPRRDLSLVRW